MKRGFALLETMIVITFVLVSLLLLYKTVDNMYKNTDRNLIYDNVANIYKTYYLKEYLELNNYIEEDGEYTCNNLEFSSCTALFENLNINKIYVIKNKKDITDNNLKAYLQILDDNKNYLVVEFKNDKKLSYASLELNGDNDE